MNKKGQITLGQVPSAVLIVGMLFLLLATFAFVADKYQTSLVNSGGTSRTVSNEVLTTVDEVGEYLATYKECGFSDLVITTITNKTSATLISTGNYTYNSAGKVNFKAGGGVGYNNTDWNVTYSYTYGTEFCNVTRDLSTEIDNNTGLAGIVLTIILVGVVLGILVTVFAGYKTGKP